MTNARNARKCLPGYNPARRSPNELIDFVPVPRPIFRIGDTVPESVSTLGTFTSMSTGYNLTVTSFATKSLETKPSQRFIRFCNKRSEQRKNDFKPIESMVSVPLSLAPRLYESLLGFNTCRTAEIELGLLQLLDARNTPVDSFRIVIRQVGTNLIIKREASMGPRWEPANESSFYSGSIAIRGDVVEPITDLLKPYYDRAQKLRLVAQRRSL